MASLDGVLVVGSIAQDFVESPTVKLEGELGGSAPYFALAARHFGPVAVVGCVGADRASELREALDFADLSRLSVTQEPTYTWRARRDAEDADAETLERFAGGYAGYRPEVGPPEQLPGTVFLGSADPAIQLAVAEAAPLGTLMAADTMDVFIESQRKQVEEVMAYCRLLFATERELEMLSRTRGIAAAATRVLEEFELTALVIKRGADGTILWTRDVHERLSPPAVQVVDPTGAGDALAGGMMGRLAEAARARDAGRPAPPLMDSDTLLEALEWGMVTAAFAIAAPGLSGIRGATREAVWDRLGAHRGRRRQDGGGPQT
jgi:sugar/nucleoside kinase (ribokinase family)